MQKIQLTKRRAKKIEEFSTKGFSTKKNKKTHGLKTLDFAYRSF